MRCANIIVVVHKDESYTVEIRMKSENRRTFHMEENREYTMHGLAKMKIKALAAYECKIE